MLGFLVKFRKGVASIMLWLIIAVIITIAVIAIIWFLTGKLMGWDINIKP
ncbi:MAG: hypothetical protein QXN71_02390 [Candidatus Aenigmatarchaeota archaeon]